MSSNLVLWVKPGMIETISWKQQFRCEIGYDKHLILGWDSKVRGKVSTNVARAKVPPLTAYVGLSLLLVLSLAPRSFSPGTRVYPFSQNQHFQDIPTHPYRIYKIISPGRLLSVILLKQLELDWLITPVFKMWIRASQSSSDSAEIVSPRWDETNDY